MMIRKNRNRIWGGPAEFTAWVKDPIDTQAWVQTQKALDLNLDSPLYVNLYFDGIDQRWNADYRRAIVDFAVSAEVFLRSRVMEQVPESLNPQMYSYLDEAGIRIILERFVVHAMTGKGRRKIAKMKSDLHALFTDRNTILHSGNLEILNEEIVESHQATVKNLLDLGDDPDNWSTSP